MSKSLVSIEYRYDGTFQGFLTAIFDIYSRKKNPEAILPYKESTLLFTEKYEVIADVEKSERVYNGIIRVGGERTAEHIYYAFLSDDNNVEMTLLRYVRHLFLSEHAIMDDLSHPDVLKVHKLYRTVSREAHRILMFLRFEQAADGTYFAPFAPKYDVVPFTLGHFKDRFSGQKWIIYDTVRNYGFYYDTQNIERIVFDNPAFCNETGQLFNGVEHSGEDKWQDMWRAYFKSIAIAERKNLALQRNFMPKRFWKYLTEKK